MEAIQELVTKTARLEQLAEECGELCQAALKLSRKWRNENPTEKPEHICIRELTEEMADVMCCIETLSDVVDLEAVGQEKVRKTKRWMYRIQEIRKREAGQANPSFPLRE